MADEVIKKFRTPITDMPPISSVTEGYSIRYRVVSADKNRNSHWSPVYLVRPEYTFLPGSIAITTGGQIVNVVWDSATILKDTATVQSITTKQLTSDIATLTTSGAHYMNVGDYVTVENVDAVFNGTYQLSAITTTTFSYYKENTNIVSTPVTPEGTFKRNSLIVKALEYDIWVRWDRSDSGDWIYKERIESTNVSFPVPSTYTINGAIQPSSPNKFSIEVYLKGYPIERGEGVPLASGTPFLKIYQSLNHTV